MSTDGLDLGRDEVPELSEARHARSVAERAAQAAVIDLDSLERDDPAVGLPPFAFTFEGRRIELQDPVEIDWQDLVEMSRNPGSFAMAAMSPADRKFFEQHTVPTWKIEKLVNAYQEYYDIDDKSGKRRA